MFLGGKLFQHDLVCRVAYDNDVCTGRKAVQRACAVCRIGRTDEFAIRAHEFDTGILCDVDG